MPSHRYILPMFPYPSGRPHLGHVRVYTITDTAARLARRQGHAVLHPMGWDAFGLPAENAALRHGVDPAAWTASNIEALRTVWRAMGWSFDWDHELDTSSPDYYRHTQQIFLWMWERGLANIVEGLAWWCPGCQTVLAEEQVVNTVCWRCSAPVSRRLVPQWTLKITAYAQRLWDDLQRLTEWDPRAVAIQRRWIGRAEGRRARLTVSGGGPEGEIELFVPKDEAIAARAVLLAPEHAIAWQRLDPALRESALSRSAVERVQGRAQLLIPTGLHAGGLPVWISDAVVPSYGVAAIPYLGGEPRLDEAGLPEATTLASEPDVAFQLRDWSVGRQRRWGCPIPMVRCERCGIVPVPASELPVRVGAPPDRPCPRCSGPALRESDTLDTFVCSAWYAFRFTSPHEARVPFRKEAVARWMPISLYVGGLDHAAQHMLYFRFVTKVLADLGAIDFDEPVTRFVCNGLVRNADGSRMSKTLGGVDPGELLERYSPDALRLAVLADTPVERDKQWKPDSVAHKERFLQKWGEAIDAWLAAFPGEPGQAADWPDPEQVRRLDALRQRLERDISSLALHNAVARLHELATALGPILEGGHHAPPAARALVKTALASAGLLVPGWAARRWPETWGALPW